MLIVYNVDIQQESKLNKVIKVHIITKINITKDE